MAEVAEADKVVLVKVADEHKEVHPDNKYVELADQLVDFLRVWARTQSWLLNLIRKSS